MLVHVLETALLQLCVDGLGERSFDLAGSYSLIKLSSSKHR